MLQGRVTYHFRTKEDMLNILIQELMDFHGDIIDEIYEKVQDNLFSFAMEITAQISLCAQNETLWDLYYSAYAHPATFTTIKDWAARKNYNLLKEFVPDWTESKFREIENVVSCIEFSAFTTPTNKFYTIENKISVVLDSIMKIYNIPKEDRERTISTVLGTNYMTIGREMFDKFIERLDNGTKK